MTLLKPDAERFLPRGESALAHLVEFRQTAQSRMRSAQIAMQNEVVKGMLHMGRSTCVMRGGLREAINASDPIVQRTNVVDKVGSNPPGARLLPLASLSHDCAFRWFAARIEWKLLAP